MAAGELGGEALGMGLDVTNRPGFTAFLDEVEQRLGPLDVLVNNAGIMPTGRFEEEGDAVVIRQLDHAARAAYLERAANSAPAAEQQVEGTAA